MKVDTIINLAVLTAVGVAGVFGYRALSGLLASPEGTASSAGTTTGKLIKTPWSFGKALGEETNPFASYNDKRRAREDAVRAEKEKAYTDAFRDSMAGLAPLNIAAQKAADTGQWTKVQYREFVTNRQHLSDALDHVYKSKFGGMNSYAFNMMAAVKKFDLWNKYAKAQRAKGNELPLVTAAGWSNA